MMAITPKYPCFCRVGECCRISVDHLELALKRWGFDLRDKTAYAKLILVTVDATRG
jgi:hypothetical protein